MADPDSKEPLGPEHVEEWDEEPPRSLLSRTWFRVVLVVLVVGAVAAVAVPFVMDAVQAPSPAVTRAPAPPAEKKDPAPPPAAPSVAAPVTPAAPVATAVAEPAKVAAPTKPEPPKSEPPKPPKAEAAKPDAAKTTAAAPKAAATKSEPTKSDAATTKAKAKATPTAKSETSGDLWVQVGAFRDPATATKVAAALKERGYQVAESTLTRGGSSPPAGGAASSSADKYDVLVAGAEPAEVAQKLTAKGLSVETVREGAVVRPSLPLRDAVTLSNDLRGEGFTVTVRRVAPLAATAAPAAASAPSSGGETLHRVRVGAFPDRPAATTAVEKLRELGYTPFIARGRE